MEEKVNHGDLFFQFYNRNDKQVPGAELKLLNIINNIYNSLLFSLDSIYSHRYKNYYIYNQYKKGIRNNNSINSFIEISLDSNSLLNKSLEECRLLKISVKTPMQEIEDVQDMEEKVNHGDLFVKFYNRNDKQVTGAELKFLNIINDTDNSLLVLLDSNYSNRYINYYICKCLLPVQIPVTDILILGGLFLYRNNIITHKFDSSDFEILI